MATDPPARRSLRAALTLLAVASVAFGVVALVHERTRADIAAAARARQQEQFAAVLAGRPFDNDPLQDVVELRDVELLGTASPVPVHRARLQGKPVAVIMAAVAPDGYSGPIELLVGIAQGNARIGGLHRTAQIRLDPPVCGAFAAVTDPRALAGASGRG
jgi:Na+-translocating ferredoxin:NAD+ oxidoreductase subunit G